MNNKNKEKITETAIKISPILKPKIEIPTKDLLNKSIPVKRK